ncbi:MAG TPA: transcriptional regulator NrdR [Rhodospirillaceae bacterium]|nr:transcriptional repressor NrdR [Alphaproteobacteria bacterium]HBH26912.1 transcriptional regulator NrdR [Rhodospirillaceae bacterium]
MRCPFCGNEETQVRDSRWAEDGAAVRRRRACPACDKRFTTVERVQLRDMTVVKAGGRRQPLDPNKIVRSMAVALRKRPVEGDAIEAAARGIVQTLERTGEAEVSAAEIGARVMDALAALDAVGYIRYASVYKDFRDPGDFDAFLAQARKLPNGRG